VSGLGDFKRIKMTPLGHITLRNHRQVTQFIFFRNRPTLIRFYMFRNRQSHGRFLCIVHKWGHCVCRIY